VEPDEIDVLASTVLRDLKQIQDTQKSRLSRQLWSDIRKTDRLNRIHFDLTFIHTVPGAHSDVGTRPYADTASDFSPANSLAKPLGEHHEESLHSAEAGGGALPWFGETSLAQRVRMNAWMASMVFLVWTAPPAAVALALERIAKSSGARIRLTGVRQRATV